ncbi:papain-like cysteine protease family protein [Aquabacterium sp.]|uniref:papain-like cysteine protease family protein n=1 Tax=Aquabacterium sp. TaxID=1872578 RepID=UPI002CD244B1|nr:papain-like cysteine protease family protein [Aquabacterium sp.]HSW08390.1 papain-like cysteine protease family protein [Aquabacterium sp.]
MDQVISGSVGTGGANRAADVSKVQALLNGVPVGWGGPTPPLAVDGLIGPKTLTAIQQFQTVQLGTLFTPDARVDPRGRTLGRLNHIANTSERPGGNVKVSVEPISHVRQKTSMVCWAAAGTMLVAARDRASVMIETVMKTADANDPGPGYLNMFNTNQGLPPANTGRYTRSIGMRVEPPINFSLPGWRDQLLHHGAIGVVGLSPFLHIRVISELIGDGSVFGSFVTVHDPGMALPYKEVFVSFAQRYEAAATVNDRMDQIWHK